MDQGEARTEQAETRAQQSELMVEWRFYEAPDFVKTRWKIISFIFDPFGPPFDNNSPLWLWC